MNPRSRPETKRNAFDLHAFVKFKGMLAGTKTLVVFADNLSPKHSDVSQHPHLNRVAAEGVTGWLVVRRDAIECTANHPGVALAQVLGVMPDKVAESRGYLGNISGFESTPDSGSDFKSRFCGLQISVYTNAPPVLGLRKSLGIECELIDLQDNGAETQVSDLVLSRFESGAEIILLHLDAQLLAEPAASADSERPCRCLRLLDQIAGRVWGSGDGDILQCVVVAGSQHQSGRAGLWGLASAPHANGRDGCGPSDDDGEALLAHLRPAQSCDMHDGRRIAPPAAGGAWREQLAMYAMHHRQGTRCDHVAAFTAQQVLERGQCLLHRPTTHRPYPPLPLPASLSQSLFPSLFLSFFSLSLSFSMNVSMYV
jgi:hypothetical protein